MTAIAVAYDSTDESFVISADGRCATNTPPYQVKTDNQQKIFHERTAFVSVVHSLIGLAVIGSFEMTGAIHRQIQMLSKRKFNDGYEYATSLCSNLTRMLERAIVDGRLPDIPASPDLPLQETGRVFRLILFGYCQGVPFFTVRGFYYKQPTHTFEVRAENRALSQDAIFPIGCDPIARQVFGDGEIDPRISQFKHNPNLEPDALKATTNFVKACSHPAAVEIDPWCRSIGGYTHAAKLTQGRFEWLIPPCVGR